MSMLIVGTEILQKENKVLDIKASILDRGSRKFWYVRYQMFFENESVQTFEESTKVLKTEKSLKYMQTKYLAAWMARKQNELSLRKHKSALFSYYASIFLVDSETLHDYKNTKYRLERVLLDFGNSDIRKISKLDIKQWLNALIDKRSGESLSKNSRSKYLGIFHQVFERALDDGVISQNFTFDINSLMGARRDLSAVEPFEKNEVNLLLQNSKSLIYGEYLYYYLGISFNQGMSPAEILGLQYGDINLNKQTITISRNITKGKIKETKTVYRNRTIPLFDSSIPYFVNLLKMAKEKRSLWLFSKKEGGPLTDIKDIRGTRAIVKNNIKIKADTKWYKLLKDCELKYRDIKNCRHTFAVNAIESKAFTLQEIAGLLGHASLKMLIDHYARWIGSKALESDKSVNIYSDTSSDTTKKSN